jgi:AbrB family looped-hinge helix DNA binding protein
MTDDLLLTKVTRNGQITLPASVRRLTNIEEGDYIAVSVEGDTILLTPKKLIDKSQAYFWTEKWQRGEIEATEDIKSGRTREFTDVEDLIASLEAESD